MIHARILVIILGSQHLSLNSLDFCRALVRSMCEILFMCGNNSRAVIASFPKYDDDSSTNQKDEVSREKLE